MEEDDKIRLLVNEDIASNSQTENTYTGKNDAFVKETVKTSIRHQFSANVVMFVYFAAFFPMIVVTEQYIYSKLSDEYNFHPSTARNNSNCDLNETEKIPSKESPIGIFSLDDCAQGKIPFTLLGPNLCTDFYSISIQFLHHVLWK